MKITKYPFAVFSAALFTVMLITPISSIANAPAIEYKYLPPNFENLEIKPATENAIENPTITTTYKPIPSLWKSNKITSNDENIVTGISTDANQIKFDIEETGVINITVNKAAEKTANGYFVIFINLLV